MSDDRRQETNMTAFKGAAPITNPHQLLSSQRTTLKRIAMQIRQLADAEVAREMSFKDFGGSRTQVYQRKQRYRRPHQVFLVDGARGSGKTTLLLTLQGYLRFLGRPHK